MKKDHPPLRVAFRFEKIHFVFLGMVLLAGLVWQMKDFVASFAATDFETVTTLRTTEEKDDTRVLRAFQAARRTAQDATAKLSTEPNPQQQTRDAPLTINAKTKAAALTARKALVPAMQQEFAREAPGQLFDIGTAPHATPVPNPAMTKVAQTCTVIAALVLLAGIALLVVQWKRSRLPKAALVGILASALTLVLIMLGDEGAGIWAALLLGGLPIAFVALMAWLTLRVKRAATWVQAKARITKSTVEAVRHRFQGDTTKVRNKASVAYSFEAGGKTITNDRISLGMASADNVDQVMRNYRVGSTVPVYSQAWMWTPRGCSMGGDH